MPRRKTERVTGKQMRDLLSNGTRAFTKNLLKIGNFTETEKKLILLWAQTDFTDEAIQLEVGISRCEYEKELSTIFSKLRSIFEYCVSQSTDNEQ